MARYENNSTDQGIFISLNLDAQYDKGSREYILKKYINTKVNISDFDKAYKNDSSGRPIKNPLDIIAAVLYGYMTGNRSSRSIEQMLRQHIGFMYVSNCLSIDHSVICEFKNKFKEQIQSVFTNLLFLLNEMGAIDWDLVVGDGTKIKAYASKGRTIGKEKTQKLLRTYKSMAEKVMKRDSDLEQSRENREIPIDKYHMEKQRTTRLKKTYDSVISKIESITQSDDTEIKKSLETKYVNLTDPDSNIMPGSCRRHFIQGYNATMMVSNNDVIIDFDPITDAEKNHTVDMVRRVENVKTIMKVKSSSKYLFDTGFQDFDKILSLQDDGYDMYVATKERDFTDKSQKRRDFALVKTDSGFSLKCRGEKIGKPHYNIKLNKTFFYFNKIQCANCSYISECYKDASKSKQKTVSFSMFELNRKPKIDEYLEKMKSENGQKIYSRRLGKEHVFSNIKTQRNFLQTYYRGKENVRMDICWAALAQNMQKYIVSMR